MSDFRIKKVGVVGLGFLGAGISSCLLSRGFEVIGHDTSGEAIERAEKIITTAFQDMEREFNLSREMADWKPRYRATTDKTDLARCDMIVESVTENLEIKIKVFDELEAAVPTDIFIACNTSNFPITLMQKGRKYPERFVGIHWAEPAYISRFMEVIQGDQTGERALEAALWLGRRCGKEPGLLKKDIRGFITNRLFYAMLREAFYLLEEGVADIETIDRSCMNDYGWWISLCGPFRYMDLTGITAYRTVMKELFPELHTGKEVPKLMEEVVAKGLTGTQSQRGFYQYAPGEAEEWERKFIEFTFDIKRLVDKYRPVE